MSVDLPPVHGVDDERVRICRREDWAAGLMVACDAVPVSEDRRRLFIDGV